MEDVPFLIGVSGGGEEANDGGGMVAEFQPKASPPPISADLRRFLLLLELLLLQLFAVLNISAAAVDEFNALLSLKSAFHDPPDLSSWTAGTNNSNATTPPPYYCTSWRGVHCTASSPINNASEFSVTSLILTGCFLGGSLSPTISMLSNLTTINLSNTSISGAIPSTLFTSLPNLQLLDLSHNSFSGSLPPDWSRLASLSRARLQNNLLAGPIPAGVFSSPSLRRLELGHNRLSGAFPRLLPYINNSKLMAISVEFNTLSGPIPPELGLLSSLRSFYASHNSFNGSLPESFSNLTKLVNLHLQNNRLQSSIPSSWASLATTLITFNVSSNNLSGQVPPPLLQRFNASAFSDNAGLCSAIAETFLLPCPPTPTVDNTSAPPPPVSSTHPPPHPSVSSKLRLQPEIIVGAALGVVTVCLLLCLIYRRTALLGGGGGGREAEGAAATGRTTLRREEEAAAASEGWSGEGLAAAAAAGSSKFAVFDSGIIKYSYEQVVSRAGFFDTAHVVGRGRHATVYRTDAVQLSDGTQQVLAVKVFKYPIAAAAFEAQMETLTLLKYPFLLPIKAYFSDSNEKAIIYDFMPQGSLHSLLHGPSFLAAATPRSPAAAAKTSPPPPPPPLDWALRQRIAFATAQALDYLHKSRIIHKDVQSRNIFLTAGELSSRLADFGFLQLASGRGAEEAAVVEKPGYTAPEVAAGRRRYSEKSDVYSFGVVLLELVTGREAVVEGGPMPAKLSEWAAEMWEKGRGREVMDGMAWKTCPFPEYLDTAMKLALGCVRAEPAARPTMYEVVAVLEGLASNPSPLKTPDLFSP